LSAEADSVSSSADAVSLRALAAVWVCRAGAGAGPRFQLDAHAGSGNLADPAVYERVTLAEQSLPAIRQLDPREAPSPAVPMVPANR
jgi:hypothetical protein